MRVRMIETGEFAEVENCWGERLIEQGKAVIAAPPFKPAKAKAPAKDEQPNKGADDAPTEGKKSASDKKAGKNG